MTYRIGVVRFPKHIPTMNNSELRSGIDDLGVPVSKAKNNE